MKNPGKIFSIALANVRQEFFERVFLSTGFDFTRPVQVIALLPKDATLVARCVITGEKTNIPKNSPQRFG